MGLRSISPRRVRAAAQGPRPPAVLLPAPPHAEAKGVGTGVRMGRAERPSGGGRWMDACVCVCVCVCVALFSSSSSSSSSRARGHGAPLWGRGRSRPISPPPPPAVHVHGPIPKGGGEEGCMGQGRRWEGSQGPCPATHKRITRLPSLHPAPWGPNGRGAQEMAASPPMGLRAGPLLRPPALRPPGPPPAWSFPPPRGRQATTRGRIGA